MAQVITGAKAYIKLSGDLIAFAAGVSVTHENRLEEIPQLDDLEVAEYAENGHRCSVNITSIKLASNASQQNNAASFNLDFNGDIKQILLQGEMIIEIVEAVPTKDASGQITSYSEVGIYTAFGAKFEGGSGQLDARGIWQGAWSFKARRGFGI